MPSDGGAAAILATDGGRSLAGITALTKRSAQRKNPRSLSLSVRGAGSFN